MLPNITEAEEKVMSAIWGYTPSTLGEISERLHDVGWSSKTVKTLIKRLCEKGAVGIEQYGRRNRYYPLIDKDVFVKRQIGTLASRLFGGSVHELMAFFCKSQELSPDQARELIALLEEKEKRQ